MYFFIGTMIFLTQRVQDFNRVTLYAEINLCASALTQCISVVNTYTDQI